METMKNGELSRTTIVMFLAVTEVLDGFLSTLYNSLLFWSVYYCSVDALHYDIVY